MEPVTVRIVGSGTVSGHDGRFQTCFWIEAPGFKFLLDCGATSITAIRKSGLDPSEISAILITHLHGDHFGGIPFFMLEAQFSKREAPLTIAGPPGIQARTREAMEVLFPKSSETRQRFGIEFIELPAERPTSIGPLSVTAYPVIHFSGATPYALRIECAGRTIAYSGDTEWTEKLIPAATGADLFLCEGYMFDKKVKYHLDYQTLMANRGALDCKRVVLTHMGSDMLSRVSDIA
ncbi:MAG TPA: MBL fold metallo-hydrolase, partial [Thermodesulfobacteriota bacterium]|nr:MBL fold metallo-hydrolase [Thermodesulfobacteriota bacterium]